MMTVSGAGLSLNLDGICFVTANGKIIDDAVYVRVSNPAIPNKGPGVVLRTDHKFKKDHMIQGDVRIFSHYDDARRHCAEWKEHE